MRQSLLFFIVFSCASSGSVLAGGQAHDGREIFLEYCASCHGTTAKGGTITDVAGAGDPPDLTQIAERRGSVWPMLEVMSIVDGYTKQSQARTGMPIIRELSQGPHVDFDSGNGLVVSTPARLIALVEYLESIQSPKPQSYVP